MQQTLVKIYPFKIYICEWCQCILLVASEINYLCSDSKVELQKIKMQVSKWSIYIKARAILNMKLISTETKGTA